MAPYGEAEEKEHLGAFGIVGEEISGDRREMMFAKITRDQCDVIGYPVRAGLRKERITDIEDAEGSVEREKGDFPLPVQRRRITFVLPSVNADGAGDEQ